MGHANEPVQLGSGNLDTGRLMGSNPEENLYREESTTVTSDFVFLPALAARFWLESILPPSRVNAVAETVAALDKGYRAIGGMATILEKMGHLASWQTTSSSGMFKRPWLSMT
jgi:hypothetical protein